MAEAGLVFCRQTWVFKLKTPLCGEKLDYFDFTAHDSLLRHDSPIQMSKLELTSHKVLVFDVYGTLIDWESGIYNSLKPLFPKDTPREEVLERYAAAELDLQLKDSSVAYSKILHLAWLRLSGQANTSFGRGGPAAVTEEGEGIEASTSAVTQQDLDPASSTPFRLTSDAERFGASIPTWQPFEDTIQALHRLKEHFALVVLSNVDNRSFGRTHELLKSTHSAKSRYPTETPDSPFSLILTAQQLNAYKPDSRVLETALQQVSSAPRPILPHPSPPWAVEAHEVLVVANSLLHDIEPANLHNLNSVWISRHDKNIIGTNPELKERGMWTWRFETLGDLADAVDKEVKEARGAT